MYQHLNFVSQNASDTSRLEISLNKIQSRANSMYCDGISGPLHPSPGLTRQYLVAGVRNDVVESKEVHLPTAPYLNHEQDASSLRNLISETSQVGSLEPKFWFIREKDKSLSSRTSDHVDHGRLWVDSAAVSRCRKASPE